MRLKDFNTTAEYFPHTPTMPVLFVGHGSPMNAIENNEFTQAWSELGKNLAEPTAILCISAHWLSRGTFVTAMEIPKTIHDFYGFPKELEAATYPAPGSPALAELAMETLDKIEVGKDMGEWGLDHGSWSVLKHIFPKADIPVVELSIDYTKDLQWHYDLAKELQQLRNKGVLIVGSGNIVHNLRMINWQTPHSGFDWAVEANDKLKKLIADNDISALVQYQQLGAEVQYAVPTPDHYIPMLYALGLRGKDEIPHYFNDKEVMGSLSMTSFQLG